MKQYISPFKLTAVSGSVGLVGLLGHMLVKVKAAECEAGLSFADSCNLMQEMTKHPSIYWILWLGVCIMIAAAVGAVYIADDMVANNQHNDK
jgi:hypothetical protein